jgi:MFS family permease
VTLFAVASVVSAAAGNPSMLIAGRFGQGLGEALAAPAALGIVVLLFQDPHERVKALGIWGGLSGLGGVTGTVISGVLTGLASWRWIFYINLPVAIVAIALIPMIVKRDRPTRAHRGRLDVTGALLGTAGLLGIVYGLLEASSSPWGSWPVLAPLIGGVALVAAMVFVEARSISPLIPLRFFADRVRVVSYVSVLVYAAGFLSYVFLLNLFEQEVLGFAPLQGGLSFVPLGLGIGAGIAVSTALMPKLGSKTLLGCGLIGVAGGLAITSGIAPTSSYASGILPGMLVIAFFSGSIMPAATNAAFHGVAGDDVSLASAVQNVMQQIGGALGLAALVSLALRHAQTASDSGVDTRSAAVDGYGLAFKAGAIILAIVGTASLVLLRTSAIPAAKPLEEEHE